MVSIAGLEFDDEFAELMGLPELSKGITFNELCPKELETKRDSRVQPRWLCGGLTSFSS
jgi:hypothetical protein